MGRQVVIADAGPIFSLALIDRLDLLEVLFGNIFISPAVWREVTSDPTTGHHQRIFDFFHDRVCPIKGANELSFITDLGESEAITLCKETEADFLLIDDKKARRIAETLGIKCIGTICHFS